MISCSIKETCKIWAELWDCLHGHNRFGSTVCEIYSYRLQEYKPSAHGQGLREELREPYKLEVYREAAISLVMILREFCREYECMAEIDDLNINEWADLIGRPGHFNHRCHIAIIKEKQ